MAQQRRPTTTRSCVSTVDSNAMVMDATTTFWYQLETNQADLTAGNESLVTDLLRDAILQSLVNAHCPGKLNRRPRNNNNRHLELEVLSLHASAATTDSSGLSPQLDLGGSNCQPSTSSSQSCGYFFGQIMLLYNSLSSENSNQADLTQNVLQTIQKYMENNLYTGQVNHHLAAQGQDLQITALSYVDPALFPSTEDIETVTVGQPDAQVVLNEDINNTSVTGLTVHGFQAAGNSEMGSRDNNRSETYLILFSCLSGFLLVLLLIFAYRRHRVGRRRAKDNASGHVLPGRDMMLYIRKEEEKEEIEAFEDEDGYAQWDMPPDRTIASARQNPSLAKSLEEMEAEFHSRRFQESTLLDTIMENVEVGQDPPGNTNYPSLGPEATELDTRFCQSPYCSACKKASPQDPNYLCPNYQTPENMRIFEEESVYHDKSDTHQGFVVSIPSNNSLLAGTNEAMKVDGTAEEDDDSDYGSSPIPAPPSRIPKNRSGGTASTHSSSISSGQVMRLRLSFTVEIMHATAMYY
jgi:hypothetical protein